jgi:hypothetical protein
MISTKGTPVVIFKETQIFVTANVMVAANVTVAAMKRWK